MRNNQFMNAEPEDSANVPEWSDTIKIRFLFRDGKSKTIEIDTTGMTNTETEDLRNQLLGKRRLLQSIFEHGTHGQITVQGITVRADDLIAMELT